MSEAEFLSLSAQQRLSELKLHGEHIGSRRHLSHQVHLYRLHGFFCELWMRAGLNVVEWVEVARHHDILSEYVQINTKDLLR